MEGSRRAEAFSGRAPGLQDQLEKGRDSFKWSSGPPELSSPQSGASPMGTGAWLTALDREEGFEGNKVSPTPGTIREGRNQPGGKQRRALQRDLKPRALGAELWGQSYGAIYPCHWLGPGLLFTPPQSRDPALP